MNPPCNLAEFARAFMPPGMKFCPSDQEMIVNYLYQKITGTLTCFQTEIVRECDLYGNEEPWQVWEKYKGSTVVDMEQNLYFFTRLKTKNTAGKRILRRVGRSEGTWHGEDAGSKINCSVMIGDDEVCLHGYKKRFNYRNPKSDQHGLWIMHEYSLSCTDFVVCRLKYSKSSTIASPSILLPRPPPVAAGLSETRPWISLACGSGDEISSTCGETSKQAGKIDLVSGQIEVEMAKKDDAEMIEQKDDADMIEQKKDDADMIEQKDDAKMIEQKDDAKMIEQKNEKSVSAAEAKNDESTGTSRDVRKKVNGDNDSTAGALEKLGIENEGSNSVEHNDLDGGEMTSEKKEIVFPIVRSPVLETSDGQTNAKKNIDRGMNDQKKGVAASTQERGISDFEKNVLGKGKKDYQKDGISDFEKNVLGKGKKDYQKAKSDREKNEYQRKGKATSVNALMGRLNKKDELATKPLPNPGRGRAKRPRVEQECTGEDEAPCKKGKNPGGSMDVLIEALGLNE
ncbi:NAC transcription factor NAM-1 [Linum grandiflorum]